MKYDSEFIKAAFIFCAGKVPWQDVESLPTDTKDLKSLTRLNKEEKQETVKE